MSHENVEVVRRGLSAFERLDVDALVALTTPDFEWFPSMAHAVEGGSFRGRDGIETYISEVRDTWMDVRMIGDPQVRDLAGERVLLLGRVLARGAASGTPAEAPLAQLYEFRDGKIARLRTFLDHGEALRAAGLSE